MKIKIEIKNRFTGKILFEFETENNNTSKTLIEAVKQGADLQGAYLRGAGLQGADLQGADLQGAGLQGAYLRGAYLQGADLQGAYLRGADLQGACLRGACLRGACLRGAYLRGACLRGACLRGADLQGAYLRGADLQGADLQGADLQGAYLQGAYLRGADGEKITIKKASLFTGLYDYISMPIITEDGKEYVKMGCYTRLLSEWENDFWNNPSEFPKDNSFKSTYRVMAFEFCKKWIELNR